MATIRATFTKSYLSPASWLIRWALPRSRFALALSSHVYIHDIDDEDVFYDAILFKGVRKIDKKEMLKGSTIVKVVEYTVPDAKAGMVWVKNQVNKKYDLKGAIGLSLTPDRQWLEDDSWHCYELLAGVLKYSGRNVFVNVSHVTETSLLSIHP
jgi:hypothetical protein